MPACKQHCRTAKHLCTAEQPEHNMIPFSCTVKQENKHRAARQHRNKEHFRRFQYPISLPRAYAIFQGARRQNTCKQGILRRFIHRLQHSRPAVNPAILQREPEILSLVCAADCKMPFRKIKRRLYRPFLRLRQGKTVFCDSRAVRALYAANKFALIAAESKGLSLRFQQRCLPAFAAAIRQGVYTEKLSAVFFTAV